MMRSEARVKTKMAARYLAQLCKHFAHRLPVNHDGDTGRIEFPSGVCALRAEQDVLVLQVEAGDAEAREQLQAVIDRHLERFAFRDKPQIAWQPGPPQRETYFA